MHIRYYIDPGTGLPHIYNHGVDEDEVEDILANPNEVRQNIFPPGWDEDRVRDVIAYYEQQTEDEAVAEAEEIFGDNFDKIDKMPSLSLHEIVADIHNLQTELEMFEQRYGILSETFYEAYSNGEKPEVKEWALDWAEWEGTYRCWLRRQKQYQYLMKNLQAHSSSLSTLIGQVMGSQTNSIPVAA